MPYREDMACQGLNDWCDCLLDMPYREDMTCQGLNEWYDCLIRHAISGRYGMSLVY